MDHKLDTASPDFNAAQKSALGRWTRAHPRSYQWSKEQRTIEKAIEDDYQAVREVVMVDACAVCTHSRGQHFEGRLACSYVFDGQPLCSCTQFFGLSPTREAAELVELTATREAAELVELRPTREENVACEHGWRGTLIACPRCQMEAPKDWFSTLLVVLLLACNAVFVALMVACIVFWLS